jgi:hypothetical protein
MEVSAAASGGTSWRTGEIVAFDAATGEHEVAFLPGAGGDARGGVRTDSAPRDLRCHLFLQTLRWLPSKYEPYMVGRV